MKNTVGIRREDDSKRGERRVALTPASVRQLADQGIRVIVQPAENPATGKTKRAFPDDAYRAAGAEINEDLSEARIIFGIKEVETDKILKNRTYVIFSHTHKGQTKNREMLAAFKKQNSTLIDYELITDSHGRRTITAFTYFAGYAGMVDSLWTLGKRHRILGAPNLFERIPQSREPKLDEVREIIRSVGREIDTKGTTSLLPPLITCFCGTGKTSIGAREIYDLLPTEAVTIEQLPEIFENGSRNKVYKLVLEVYDMYRLRPGSPAQAGLNKMSDPQRFQHYIDQPALYESNLYQVLPYATLLMNCIIWTPEYPRLITRQMIREIYPRNKTLRVIGDITCDPEGAIHFSKETWVDDPVFVYNPEDESQTQGFEGPGIAVMAVTNLPCEFPIDASVSFNQDLQPEIPTIVSANFDGSLEESNLSDRVRRAVLLWKGAFPGPYAYMESYLNPTAGS